jgi:hypothetical protein
MSGELTGDDIEDMIQLHLQYGDWFSAQQLRRLFPANAADKFWGAISTLYKNKVIERTYDMHGVTIYRLAGRDN